MKIKTSIFIILFILLFLDPFLVNIPVGPLHLTMLRVGLFMYSFYLLFKYVLVRGNLGFGSFRYPTVFLVAWFLYGYLSILWSFDRVVAIKELYYFGVFLLLVFAFIDLLKNKLNSVLINKFLTISGIATMGISCIEILFGYHLSTSRYVIEAERFIGSQDRVATAFFYNENDLSLFLIMLIPFFLVLLYRVSLTQKLIGLLAVLLSLGIFLVNGSRLAILALLLQVFFLVIVRSNTFIKRVVRFSFIFLPTILVVGAYLLGKYFFYLLEQTGVYQVTGSASTRVSLYLNGIYSLFRSFFLGVGPGNFEFHIYPQFNTNGIVNPHNWWIEILTNYGFLIFIGYVLFFIYLCKRLIQIYISTRNQIALVYVLGLIGFAIACMGPSRLFYFWPMWLYYAVIISFIYQQYPIKKQDEEDD